MKATAKVARVALLVFGGAALVLGLFILTGNARLIPHGLHGVMGEMMIVSLWVLGAVAMGTGGGIAVGVKAFVWGLLVQGLGYAETRGAGSWWLLGLHIVTSVGAMVWGARLVIPAVRQPTRIRDAAAEFLAKKRIAVTGVSRKTQPHGSNLVYKRLKERGYTVFAINPNAEQVEGDRCYRDLESVPGGVDAVVIGTRPETAMVTMRECVELGIKHVWMHRSVGTGSVSAEATAFGRDRGIHVIDGGCPLMFEPTADAGHKVMRPLFTLTGKVPRRVG
jgi:predicted CoA-binding protein